MKPLLLILALFVSAPAQQSDLGIVTKYDRFSNETLYKVTESLMPDRNGFVLLSFRTTYPGEHPRLTRPSSVLMLLSSYTDDWYFQRTENTVRIIQDGERYSLGRMKIVQSDVVTNGVLESLALDILFSSLERISKAKKFEMQIELYEVELKPEAIQNIRTWVTSFK